MTNIFLSLFGISVSISFIILVLILLSPILNKRYAAKWSYLIWIFLALRLLVPSSGVNGQLVMDMLSQTKAHVSDAKENDNDGHADVRIAPGRIVVEIPAQMTTPIAGEDAMQLATQFALQNGWQMTMQHVIKNILHAGADNAGITILDIVTCVWMMGSLILLSVHFISYSHYRRCLRKRGKVIGDAHILGQISELKRELHIRRAIRVIAYSNAGSPLIIGFIKPVLVLPKERYSPEEQYFILKHELVHFKRGDVFVKLLFVTASALHWFNPIIWMMQKEAAVAMELSCDERVTKGASFAVRKAYTETLLSMLHKRVAGRTVLSTQFYGGTKIMKKRFTNILSKRAKKNGIAVLICAVIMTISLGTLVGCSIAKEDTGREAAGYVPDLPEEKELQKDEPDGDSLTDNDTSDHTITLTFSKEGEQEQKKAALATGDGYSIYLPEGEWQQSDTDTWSATVNEQVRLWVTHFEGESLDSVEQKLADDGYNTVNFENLKQVDDIIYHVVLKEFENDIWGIFSCYPIDAQEGWGSEIPVIADSFAAVMKAYDAERNRSDDSGEYLTDDDCENMKNIALEFAAAYFNGKTDAMEKFLASTYEGPIDTFEGSGVVSNLTVKGLSDTDEKKVEDGRYTVSVEFRDSDYEDMLQYLTVLFVRQEERWNIQFYGIEG